jgi:hypothetical protein
MRKAVVVAVVLVVLGALGGGFYLIGPPAEQRLRAFDERREMDLQRLRLAADLYWTRNKRLPASLDDLATEAGTNIYARDPKTSAPYAYVVKGPDAYELCAEFERASEQRGDFWSHGGGRQCYSIRAKEIRP